MKAITYFLQILAGIFYSVVFAGLIYFLITIPALWIFSFSGFKLFALLFLWIMILGGLAAGIQALATLPYMWICKMNIVSTILSIAIISIILIGSCVRLWMFLYNQGFWPVVITIGISIEVIIMLYITIICIVMAYRSE